MAEIKKEVKEIKKEEKSPLKLEGYLPILRIPIRVDDLATYEQKFQDRQHEMVKIITETFRKYVTKNIQKIDHKDEFVIVLAYKKTGRN